MNTRQVTTLLVVAAGVCLLVGSFYLVLFATGHDDSGSALISARSSTSASGTIPAAARPPASAGSGTPRRRASTTACIPVLIPSVPRKTDPVDKYLRATIASTLSLVGGPCLSVVAAKLRPRDGTYMAKEAAAAAGKEGPFADPRVKILSVPPINPEVSPSQALARTALSRRYNGRILLHQIYDFAAMLLAAHEAGVCASPQAPPPGSPQAPPPGSPPAPPPGSLPRDDAHRLPDDAITMPPSRHPAWFILLEDDFVWCPGAGPDLAAAVAFAEARAGDPAMRGVRLAPGLNGLLLRCADMPSMVADILTDRKRDPLDYLLASAWARGSRGRIFTFSRVLLLHVGDVTATGHMNKADIPQCGEVPCGSSSIPPNEWFAPECRGWLFSPCSGDHARGGSRGGDGGDNGISRRVRGTRKQRRRRRQWWSKHADAHFGSDRSMPRDNQVMINKDGSSRGGHGKMALPDSFAVVVGEEGVSCTEACQKEKGRPARSSSSALAGICDPSLAAHVNKCDVLMMQGGSDVGCQSCSFDRGYGQTAPAFSKSLEYCSLHCDLSGRFSCDGRWDGFKRVCPCR